MLISVDRTVAVQILVVFVSKFVLLRQKMKCLSFVVLTETSPDFKLRINVILSSDGSQAVYVLETCELVENDAMKSVYS